MLTKKQKELLDFITIVNKKDGICPSYDEMKDKLELKSKSGIHRLITSLEQRGFIRRLKHKARAMEITKHIPNKNVHTINSNIEENYLNVPLIGSIAEPSALKRKSIAGKSTGLSKFGPVMRPPRPRAT